MPDPQELHERWRFALDAGEAALFELDAATLRVTVVPGSMIGLDDDASLSFEEFLARVNATDRARVGEALRKLVARKTGVYRDAFRVPSGSWVSARGGIIGDDAGAVVGVAGVLVVETDRRQADDAKNRAIQELSLAARASDIFVSMLAHDIKNPVGIIVSTAHTAVDGLPGPQMRRAIERIRSSGERLVQIIEYLREYARTRPADVSLGRRDADLSTIVERAIDLIETPANLVFEGEGDATGTWDAARIEHAVTALVSDAVQRSGADRRVGVRVDGTATEVVRLEITSDAVLDARVVANAFRPFGAEASQGLGLFAARQAFAAHGGEVVLESSAAGTILRAVLPRRVDVQPSSSNDTWEELQPGNDPQVAAPVTASLYGAVALHERAPVEYWKLFERYAAVFDDALNRRVYRGEPRKAREETRAIADALGALGAGAQEVAELHARALRLRLRGASAGRGQALIAEGRLVAFELMGDLLTWYRKRATVAAPDPSSLD